MRQITRSSGGSIIDQQTRNDNLYYTLRYQTLPSAPSLRVPPRAYQASSATQYSGVGQDVSQDLDYQQEGAARRQLTEQESQRLGDLKEELAQRQASVVDEDNAAELGGGDGEPPRPRMSPGSTKDFNRE
jgi:hypothetical protein